VADYFKTNYGMVVTDHKQPLFLIRNQDRDFYLPPEFCLLDGVSDEVRKGRGMRDALMQTRITPQTKIKKIQDMCRELFSKKSIKQWGLELEPQPIRMSTSILAAPRILKQNQVINCDESVLRRLPIQKPVALEHEKWIFVYENRNENAANQVFQTMQMASKQLGIRVEEPYWIYTDQERNTAQLDDWLLEYMVGEDAGGKKFRFPTIVVVLLSQERNYADHKLIFDKYQMPS